MTALPASYKQLAYPPLEEFRPTEPVVKELPNGLRVYLMEDHEIPLVRMRAMVRGGSFLEPAEKAGLASLTGRVMRTGGTTRNPGDHLDEELGALAASMDVQVGALSGGASAESLAETMPRVLELFADVIRHPTFPEAKIELAKSAARTAISRRNDQIGSMAARAFQIAMYGKDSPLAREPEYATIDAITREDLARFHDRIFRSDRVSIGFVGSFDSKRVMQLVEKYFGDWQRSDEPLPTVAVDPLPVQGTTVYFAEKNDVNQTNLYIGAPGVRYDNPDWAALRVGSFVLGSGGFSSRMMKKVRAELGLSYSVGAGIGAEFDRVGLFRAVCQTKSSTTGQAIDAMLSEIDAMLNASPPTEAEIQLAKDQILNTEVFEYESKAGILGRRMTLDFYGYPKDFNEQLNRKIRSVKASDVVSAYRRHLDTKNLKIVAVGNPSDFDKKLDTYGPVTVLDLSIPEPPAPRTAEVSEDSLAAGAKAVDALLARAGGRERWKELRSMRVKASMSRNQPPIGRMELRGTETFVFPNRSHIVFDVETPMGALTITRVVVGDAGWIRQQNPQDPDEVVVSAIPAAQLKQSSADKRTDWIVLLHSLATGTFTGALDGNRLQILEKGSPVATLTLGSDGLPKTVAYRSFSGADAVRTIEAFGEKDGMFYASSWETKDGQGDPAVQVAEVEWNVDVDEAIFEKPKSGAGD